MRGHDLLIFWLRAWRWLHPVRRRWMPLRLWWSLQPPIRVYVMTAASLSQSGFAFYNDDGTESTATIIGTEDNGQTLNVDTVYHIRIQVDDTASGGENNVTLKIQRNLNGAGWVDINAASTVVQSAASQLTEDADTTARLAAPFQGSFISPNQCQDEVDGVAGAGNLVDFIEGVHDYVEAVFAFQILSGDVVDTDTIQFRLVRSSGVVLENYALTPQATVSEAAGAVTGTFAVTQADQTSAASGTVVAPAFAGTLAVTQDAQTSTASGTAADPAFSGTLAVTQDDQTSTASGNVTSAGVSGTAAPTQADQTSTASGLVGEPSFTGTLAVTQQDQFPTASGTVVNSGISGSLAVIQENQVSSAAGTFTPPSFTGTSTPTQDDQTSNTSGTFASPGSSGTSAVTQDDQVSTASGTVTSAGISGTLAVTQTDQTSTATGTFVPSFTGTMAVTQDDQTLSASGIPPRNRTEAHRVLVATLEAHRTGRQ